jgi:hypothetical protein
MNVTSTTWVAPYMHSAAGWNVDGPRRTRCPCCVRVAPELHRANCDVPATATSAKGTRMTTSVVVYRQAAFRPGLTGRSGQPDQKNTREDRSRRKSSIDHPPVNSTQAGCKRSWSRRTGFPPVTRRPRRIVRTLSGSSRAAGSNRPVCRMRCKSGCVVLDNTINRRGQARSATAFSRRCRARRRSLAVIHREPLLGIKGATRKCPNAGRDRGRQWVFAATRFYVERLTGRRRHHHLHETRSRGFGAPAGPVSRTASAAVKAPADSKG